MKDLFHRLGWLVGLAIASLAPHAFAGNVTGHANFVEHATLPAGVRFEAILEDITLRNAPAVRVSDIRFEDPGEAPIAFTLRVEDSVIDPNHDYSVRARITQGEQLLFTTDKPYPVLTRGHGAEVELLLHQPAPSGATPTVGLEGLPATFTGVLSCAGCEGVRHQLNLFPDHAWYLRQTWLGKRDTPRVDLLGRWEFDPERRAIRLLAETDQPTLFAIVDQSTLRKLDRTGQPLESRSNEDLQRASKFEVLQPHRPLRGIYVERDGVASFTECLSGQRWSVAPGSEQKLLSKAYAAMEVATGLGILTSVDGEVLAPPAGSPAGTPASLRVVEYDGLWPAETCVMGPPPPLEGTYWKLTRLDGKGLPASLPQQEPHVQLKAPDEISAYGGCNNLVGQYSLKRGSITVSRIASTKMACPGRQKTERLLVQALKHTNRWSIDGQYLHLFDDQGRQLARFEAVLQR